MRWHLDDENVQLAKSHGLAGQHVVAAARKKTPFGL